MNASQSSKGSEGVPLSHGVSAISGSMFAFVIADTTWKFLVRRFRLMSWFSYAVQPSQLC